MSLIDSISIQKFHRDRILKFGVASKRALGWSKEDGQIARYEIIAELLGDLTHKSVLDVGCGHGDLRGFWANKYDGLRYAGIDQIDDFLDVAIARYSGYADTAFYLGDFMQADFPVMDFVVACGSLNYRNSDPDFIFKAIDRLYQKCKDGFVFNLLKNIDSKEGFLVSYDKEKIIDYCHGLCNDIVLKEGYYSDDYTIFLKK